jgi:hypothetical protein
VLSHGPLSTLQRTRISAGASSRNLCDLRVVVQSMKLFEEACAELRGVHCLLVVVAGGGGTM